jgi:hypothetical protein
VIRLVDGVRRFVYVAREHALPTFCGECLVKRPESAEKIDELHLVYYMFL